MKLVFTKSNLNKAVGIVMKAVPTRTTMNILECILIDATTNVIKFTGNDITTVSVDSIFCLGILLQGRLFSEYLDQRSVLYRKNGGRSEFGAFVTYRSSECCHRG